ncbi:MAG: phytanoyl-CoA dioxygenase family protein [Pseudomonadales bacterium]|nr:phytanoyl-CoA dioxygenase family protein [Pseudomonadales bacterium]MCP5182499.1 phytanoyl-CoA dioxygenase family protein [Pseudomonadales bacterium]
MSSSAHDLRRRLRGEDQPGYVRLPGFAAPETGRRMLDDVIALARQAAAGRDVTPSLVTLEMQAGFGGTNPEDRVSKIFRLHRRPAFLDFLGWPRVVELVGAALGGDVDCFLSQFIFKNPGAWGQPWHQDSYYFPFQPRRPIIGLWLAITEATLENGCLHVLPGSQVEPVHTHVRDRRPDANHGYVEIVDHDMGASVPCLLDPGDLLVFDSHLMHRSTDNTSSGMRAAMVWHFATAGSIDPGSRDAQGRWRPSPVNDWMPYLRGGKTVL